MNYLGALILRERLAHNWSQAGLCKGVCTVSYLSKIETGKVEPSDEILRLLLERLELYTDSALETEAKRCAEDAYELLFTGRFDELAAALPNASDERFRATAAWMDILLLRRFDTGGEALDAGLEACMDERQLAMQRILQKRGKEALALMPNAFCFWQLGVSAYTAGQYADAVEYLQTAYDLASRDGSARLMLLCRVYIGNCCCNRHDMERMLSHYAAAKRLAIAIGERELLDEIAYNTAAAQMEQGQFEEAYAYFSNHSGCGAMELHKLAICCEKTGRMEEALAALRRAGRMTGDFQKPELAVKMLDVVRFRLKHSDYLRREEYGALLLDCFERCRAGLPQGYAEFHLPWVIEWYAAARQYKKVCELMKSFPEIRQ